MDIINLNIISLDSIYFIELPTPCCSTWIFINIHFTTKSPIAGKRVFPNTWNWTTAKLIILNTDVYFLRHSIDTYESDITPVDMNLQNELGKLHFTRGGGGVWQDEKSAHDLREIVTCRPTARGQCLHGGGEFRVM